VNATGFLFYNKQNAVEAYFDVDLYIHVFLKNTLSTEMPLTSTSDSYLSGNKEHQYVLNTVHGVRVGTEELDRRTFK
jgi:hypothetical protein